MPIKEDLQALSEVESNIKSHWEKALEYMNAKGSPVFIWEIRTTHLRLIHENIQKIIQLIIAVHFFIMHNYGSISYQKRFEKTRDRESDSREINGQRN